MSITFSRRTFCQLSLAASLSPAALWAAEAEDTGAASGSLPIIDTHQHLWDLSRFELRWLAGYPSLNHNYLLRDYWQAAQGLNIVKTIYMEVDVVPRQREAEVDYVVALSQEPDSRMAGAVVGGPANATHFEDFVRRLTKHPLIKGMRAAVATRGANSGLELDPTFVAGVRLLGECGLSFDINVQPDQLEQAAALVDQAADTRYILDHCGNISVTASQASVDRWKRGLANVAQREQVVCKVSGFISNAPGKTPTREEIARVVNHVYECFGPDRVIFASDWPVCTLAMSLQEWVTALKEVVADRPDADQRKLFHDNAARLYRV